MQQRLAERDTETELLKARVKNVETASTTISDQLTKHVTECAAIQKRVLLMVVFVAGWVVAHSPEGITVLSKVIGSVAK